MVGLESEPPYHPHSAPTRAINRDLQQEVALVLAVACAIAGSHLAPAIQRPLFLPYGSRTKVAGLLQRPIAIAARRPARGVPHEAKAVRSPAGDAQGGVVGPPGRSCPVPQAPGGDAAGAPATQPGHPRSSRTAAADEGRGRGRTRRSGYTRHRQHQDLSPVAAGGKGRAPVGVRLRAYWSICVSQGSAWTPAISTRRVDTSMTKKTRYRVKPLRPQDSQAKKSQAARLSQWLLRKSLQVVL